MSTDPEAIDPGIRSRTYPIPFGRVWREVAELVRSRPGWSLVHTDPSRGEIVAETVSALWKVPCEVIICVGLDQMGMTRVDATTTARARRPDLGAGARRISRLLRDLDAALRPSA